MKIIRAEGIPIWVTIIALFVGIMGTGLGLTALMDPTSAMGYIEGADSLALTWAGRNTGLGVALLLAVYLRNSAGYAVAFGASLLREVSDILSMSSAGIDGTVIGLIVFLLIEVACFVISLRSAIPKANPVT